MATAIEYGLVAAIIGVGVIVGLPALIEISTPAKKPKVITIEDLQAEAKPHGFVLEGKLCEGKILPNPRNGWKKASAPQGEEATRVIVWGSERAGGHCVLIWKKNPS